MNGDARPAEQRAALDAASAALRRFTDRHLAGDGDGDGDGAGSGHDGHDEETVVEHDVDRGGFNELRRSVRRTLDLYLELTERFFEASTRSLETVLRERGVSVGGGQRHGDGAPVRLSAAAGAQCSAAVWTHNGTDAPIVGATFRVTDLIRHDGAGVAASSCAVDPARIDRLDPGATAGGRLTIDIDPHAVPGVYVGNVLLSPLDDAVCAIRLEVSAP